MPLGLNLVSPPAVEPVTLSQLKQFASVEDEFHFDDELLLSLGSASRNLAEKYTHRAFFNQQWRLTLDSFPLSWSNTIKNIRNNTSPYSYFFDQITIQLPRPHLVSVDSVTFVDTTGTVQTLDPSTYVIDTDSEPGRLSPVFGKFWPAPAVYNPGSVKITYTCSSYGDGIETNTCPGNVLTAICVGAAHFYANREGNAPIPQAFYTLLDSEKFDTFSFGY